MPKQVKKRFIFLYCIMLSFELIFLFFILKTNFDSMYFFKAIDADYKGIAENLINHGVFSLSGGPSYTPTNYRTPFEPMILAAVFILFKSFLPAAILGTLFFALTAPLTYLIGRLIFSEKIAFLSGLIIGLEPFMAFSGNFLLTEVFFVPVILIFTYYFIKYLKEGRAANIYVSALFIGLATLIRPVGFYLWPLTLIFAFICQNNYRKFLKEVLIASAIAALFVVPWILRNKLVLNTWQFSSNQGIVLYTDHVGIIRTSLSGITSGYFNSNREDEIKKLVGDDPTTPEASQILTQAAFKEIKSHFGVYLKSYVISLVPFFINDSYKAVASFLGYKAATISGGFNYYKLLLNFKFSVLADTIKSVPFVTMLLWLIGKLIWGLISIGAFIGIYLSAREFKGRERLAVIFLALLILYFALTSAPSSVTSSARYRFPINGFLAIFFMYSVFKIFKFKNFKEL